MRHFIGAVSLMLAFSPATATERAYVLVETGPAGTLTESLNNGLQNCLALLAKIPPSVTVVDLNCNELADINIAVAEIAKKPGVVRATIWVLKKGE
jgi:hypothetical protein